MPHRRYWHSRRKFSDGMYQFLSSHYSEYSRDATLAAYREEGGAKVRYIKGEDGRYHIYEKVVEDVTR